MREIYFVTGSVHRQGFQSVQDVYKRQLINIADSTTKDEVERLIAGESIEKVVHLELTYNEIDKNIDNICLLYTSRLTLQHYP